MTLHVGLNLAFLDPGETGGRETYARELALAMAEARSDFRFTSFVGREAGRTRGFWDDIGRVVRLPLSPASRPQWALAEVAAVPRAAARAGVDLLHSPANFGPLSGPFARVLTLHDLLYKRHPELLTRAMRLGTGALLPLAARRAHRVVTVSRASRDEIVKELGIAPEHIDVVPNGVMDPAPGDAGAARDRLGAGERPVALSVASHLPHKNLGALLDGLSSLAPGERPLLALAGAGTDGGGLPERAAALGLEADVRLLGTVTEQELEDLYAAADLFVTTTRHEGFGIPLLEAMVRGVPVACSDLPVLREVAGDAATWLDPGDPGTIAAAIRMLAAGGPTAERLREAGLERARGFSWQGAANATCESYERALSNSGRSL